MSTLRPATAADIPALAVLARDSFVAAFGHLYRPDDLALFLNEWRTEEAYRRALAQPAKRFQLAELDGRLAAYAQIDLGDGFDERPAPRLYRRLGWELLATGALDRSDLWGRRLLD